MSAITDLNAAVANLQTAATAAEALVGVNPTEDAAVEAAVATINGVVTALNAAVAAASPAPSSIPAPAVTSSNVKA